jgi:hypothetical protein
MSTSVERFTYSEISEMTGVTKSGLQHRVHRLGLKGRTLSDDGTVFFTARQVSKIIACYKIRSENNPRKIDIIELYQQGKKGRAIASILRISVKASYDCIREYNQTGYIIVESLINNRTYVHP